MNERIYATVGFAGQLVVAIAAASSSTCPPWILCGTWLVAGMMLTRALHRWGLYR